MVMLPCYKARNSCFFWLRMVDEKYYALKTTLNFGQVTLSNGLLLSYMEWTDFHHIFPILCIAQVGFHMNSGGHPMHYKSLSAMSIHSIATSRSVML